MKVVFLNSKGDKSCVVETNSKTLNSFIKSDVLEYGRDKEFPMEVLKLLDDKELTKIMILIIRKQVQELKEFFIEHKEIRKNKLTDIEMKNITTYKESLVRELT